jgi:hypothetical protein
MTVTLTPRVEALLESGLRSGGLQDANELIATALLAFADSQFVSSSDLERDIQEGIDSADRGELYSEEEVRAYLKAMRAKL